MWLTKTVTQTAKQNVPAVYSAVQVCGYSTQPKIIKNPTTASLKRGTGGRSSFSGIVCTVFGATGFIGQYVCNRLGKIGTQMIIPYRNEYYTGPLKLAGDLGQVLFYPFHLKDEESLRNCIKYSNTVINLIGTEYETRNFSFNDVHIEGARRIARLCKEYDVERLIHVSSLNATDNPKPILFPGGSNILKTKFAGECAVKEEFPNATIVRCSDVYGQEDRFLNLYTQRARRVITEVRLWKMGKETQKQPVHVSDVAAGIVAAVQDHNAVGKTYQFFGPQRYTLHDVVHWILQFADMDLVKQDRAKVAELQVSPLLQLQCYLQSLISIRPHPWMTQERLEWQHQTDVIHPDLPTLEDLGITPSSMESRLPWEMRLFIAQTAILETPKAFELPPSPTPISTI